MKVLETIIITSPHPLKDEAILCNAMFAHGLKFLHLRKPGAEAAVYEQFIRQIEPRYRNRVVIHEHYELAETYSLQGIHLKSGQAAKYVRYPNLKISISCHSLEEIKNLPFRPTYCFLSPVFDSISKQGYFSEFPQLPDVSSFPFPIVALGGITPEKTDLCRRAGFKGVAALGYIWEKPAESLSRYLRLKTPFVMSIAGFDPSSGAGITADIKTFEATGSYGLGVCSGVTFQNENIYDSTRWISKTEIQKQCELQLQNHCPFYVKIGLIENTEVLRKITDFLLSACPEMKIIWDPVLKASAGHVFHHWKSSEIISLLPRFYLITPNTDELFQLFGKKVNQTELQEVCRRYNTRILWKGGHNEGESCCDYLITPEQIYSFSVVRSKKSKHGTGCILSAAITSALAQGDSLAAACNKAQLYTARVIDSNDSRLGYHTLHQAAFHSLPSVGQLKLQYITAPKPGVSLCEQVEAVCRGGVRWIQLRMKETSVAEIYTEGRKIKEICRRYQALFIVNDQVEVAKQLDADGVHLGKEDTAPEEARKILGPDKIIGATCNTWEDIWLRQEQQVDYIGLGPFAFTTTKKKLSPVLGLEGYRQLLNRMQENHIRIPVFAIGGIVERDIPPLMETGIQGIALSGLIKNSDHITQQTQKIITLLNHTFESKNKIT